MFKNGLVPESIGSLLCHGAGGEAGGRFSRLFTEGRRVG